MAGSLERLAHVPPLCHDVETCADATHRSPPMIHFETERLLFRDHEPADLEPYCAMESDAEYRAPQKVHPRAELERSFRDTWLPVKRMGLLATVYKPDGRYIGRCGLYPARGSDDQIVEGEARLAYYLARPYWGRGLATEAARVFVARGFETLDLRRIEAGVGAHNAASIRIVEGLGFRRVEADESGYSYELLRPPRIRR
jgi:[ribosomal protein S5]-alanine N-acetyltransferase